MTTKVVVLRDDTMKRWYESTTCAWCGKEVYYRFGPGPQPKYCNAACKQAQYRADREAAE